MNQSIAPSLVPPLRGLEKEEPELAHEEDIPSQRRNGPAWDQPAPLEPPAAEG